MVSFSLGIDNFGGLKIRNFIHTYFSVDHKPILDTVSCQLTTRPLCISHLKYTFA